MSFGCPPDKKLVFLSGNMFVCNILLKISIFSVILFNLFLLLWASDAYSCYQWCPKMRLKNVSSKSTSHCIIKVLTLFSVYVLIWKNFSQDLWNLIKRWRGKKKASLEGEGRGWGVRDHFSFWSACFAICLWNQVPIPTHNSWVEWEGFLRYTGIQLVSLSVWM